MIHLTLPGERAPGWNTLMRMHWAEQRRRNDMVWLAVRAECGFDMPLLDVPVDIHIVATFKGTPLDSDNVVGKFYLDAIKSKRHKDGTVEYRILREDDPKWVRRVTTESKRGKRNSVEITITPIA